MMLLKRLQRDLAVASVLLAAAVLGLVQVIRDLSTASPARVAEVHPVERVQVVLPLDSAEALFAPDVVASPGPPEGQVDGFHTRYFAPPVKPPKQAPTTRKVALTYLGFLQAGEGPRTAVVLEGATQWTGGLGGHPVPSLSVSAIESGYLVLTNAEGQTHQLEFRKSVELDVPVP